MPPEELQEELSEHAAEVVSSESPPSQPRPSPSDERLEADEEDGAALCRDLDPFHPLRKKFTELGFRNGEWSGIPVPIEGIDLVVEPSYGFAKIFNEQREKRHAEASEKTRPKWHESYEIVNTFYSHKKHCDIAIIRHKRTGMVEYYYRPAVHALSNTLATLFASDVWGVDQEQAALQTLGGMLRHRQFKQYLLTGMFMESSKRSGISYLFRRLRPTVAITSRDRHGVAKEDNDATILCTLCMHPIAYYEGSWAGAMCPTDDVIAHLSLMRGDEHMFWRRCNQHPPHRPEAGL